MFINVHKCIFAIVVIWFMITIIVFFFYNQDYFQEKIIIRIWIKYALIN
jgi:hypothetical protein